MKPGMAAKPTAPPPLTMKLLVDTKARSVLYAEAGKEVVDFLSSLLVLPLCAVTKLLTARAMVGSFGNLYRSVESLGGAGYVPRRGAKDALMLDSAAVLQLSRSSAAAAPQPAAPPPPPPTTTTTEHLYRCKGCSCSARCYDYATKVSGTPCPVCKGKMTTTVQLVGPEPDNGKSAGGAKAAAPADEGSSSGGYVRDMVTYTVMDDLSVAPMSTICAVTALVARGVTDISGLQNKTVEIGYKEGLALLKASLQSQTVLTDVFLGVKRGGK